MAKKKSNNVAYTPILKSPPNTLSTIQEVQLKTIPPYPDQGVKYSKYCKKLTGLNDYTIINQKTHFSWGWGDNTNAVRVFSSSQLLKRKFYLTDVLYAICDTSGISVTQPQDLSIGVYNMTSGVTKEFIKIPYVLTANEFLNRSVHFQTPIELYGTQEVDATGVISDVFYAQAINNTRWRVVIVGWFEDIV